MSATKDINLTKDALSECSINNLLLSHGYNLAYHSGGDHPQLIKKWKSFSRMNNHFVECKPIAYHKNFYTVSRPNLVGLKRCIGTINSSEELANFVIHAIAELQKYSVPSNCRYVYMDELRKNELISSAKSSSVKQFIIDYKYAIAMTTLGAGIGTVTGGAGLAVMGSAYSIPGPTLGAAVGNVAGNTLEMVKKN